jgi:hypothetical protein
VFYNGKAISIELPTSVVREVVYTEPAVKGDTSGKVMKAGPHGHRFRAAGPGLHRNGRQDRNRYPQQRIPLARPLVYNMLPAEEPGTSEGRTAATNATVRSVFVIGPDKKIKLMMTYPMTTGRNFDEILRALDSMQLTAKHKVATPVNWKQGEDVIIAGSVSDEEAKTLFPEGWKAPKPYLRIVKHP